jgi:hypothetical protein
LCFILLFELFFDLFLKFIKLFLHNSSCKEGYQENYTQGKDDRQPIGVETDRLGLALEIKTAARVALAIKFAEGLFLKRFHLVHDRTGVGVQAVIIMTTA